ncbi:MAG: hypothetical protein KDE08_09260 [Rhodobacteraceae bacterium]|nr:hypothetical protein [Paracoccaceae bacterium]
MTTAKHNQGDAQDGARRDVLWRPACLLLAGIWGLAGGSGAIADGPGPAELRRAAEALAPMALESGDPDLLLAAIRGLLDGGTTLAEDDPWNASALMARLREIDAGSGRYSDEISALEHRIRGVLSGPNRFDATLPAGAEETFRLFVTANEWAIAEARLKRGATDADIDLIVSDEAGQVVAEDIGNASGVPGIGAYVEWWPEGCAEVVITLRNVGGTDAGVVFLAPPARSQECNG